MVPVRILVAGVSLILSILGIVSVLFMYVLDMGEMLVKISECEHPDQMCLLRLNNRCLHCSGPSRYKREVEKCVSISVCLDLCGDQLINNCHDDDDDTSDEDDVNVQNKVVQVMGHAGGDPVSNCENTVASTISGLSSGMNSVHIDISVTKEGVPFLWRDHNPRTLTSRLRQVGAWGVAGCRPHVAPDMYKPAHHLSWDNIQSGWLLVNRTKGGRKGSIPDESQLVTFQEWVDGILPLSLLLSRIWISFRVPEELLRPTMESVWKISKRAEIEDKLYFQLDDDGTFELEKMVLILGVVTPSLSSLDPVQWAGVLQLLDQVLNKKEMKDTYLQDREDEAVLAVLANQEFGIETTILGQLQNTELENNYDILHLKLIDRLVESVENVLEDLEDKSSDVAVATVNNEEIMKMLICLQVDLIITDYPDKVNKYPDCSIRYTELYSNSSNQTNSVLSATELDSNSSNSKKDCMFICSREYSPVCGSDSKIYSNLCMMEMKSCESGKDVKGVEMDKCEGGGRRSWSIESRSDVPSLTSRLANEKSGNEVPGSDKNNNITMSKFLIESDYRKPELNEKQISIEKQTKDKHNNILSPRSSNPSSIRDNLIIKTDKFPFHYHNILSDSLSHNPSINPIHHPIVDSIHGQNPILDPTLSPNPIEDSSQTSINSIEDSTHKYCNRACSNEFKPLCGDDGNTYPSLCMMELSSCLSGLKVILNYEGVC